jgi:hypothetical protein
MDDGDDGDDDDDDDGCLLLADGCWLLASDINRTVPHRTVPHRVSSSLLCQNGPRPSLAEGRVHGRGHGHEHAWPWRMAAARATSKAAASRRDIRPSSTAYSIGGVHVGSANYLTEWLKQTARNGLMASSICVAQHLTYNARGLLKKAKGRYRRKQNRS